MRSIARAGVMPDDSRRSKVENAERIVSAVPIGAGFALAARHRNPDLRRSLRV
jgi:hypothetical protein